MPNRQMTWPAACPHCKKFVYNAPGWLDRLPLFSGGTGKQKVMMTKTQFAEKCGVTRERGRQLLNSMYSANTLELPFGKKAGVYCLSQNGRLLLARWRSFGWKPGFRVEGQASLWMNLR